MDESRRRGWILIAPNFRGPNDHPDACASDEAVQDVIDSVDSAKRNALVDEKRVYLLGSSGGGFMSLMMAVRAPQLWTAVSVWVPITDLVAWHEFSKATGPEWNNKYDKMMEAFGGKGYFVTDPKDLKAALDGAMKFKGPALVNVQLHHAAGRKPQQFGWHTS